MKVSSAVGAKVCYHLKLHCKYNKLQYCRLTQIIDMFLYAHLAIEYLLQQPTKEKLLEKIKEEMLPKELSQMYV